MLKLVVLVNLIIIAVGVVAIVRFRKRNKAVSAASIIVLIAVITIGNLYISQSLFRKTVVSSTGDEFDFNTLFIKEGFKEWEEIDASKKKYDIGDGLVYEHLAAYTDGKKVIRVALINYYPSQIPQAQLAAAKESLAYLFTEAGETYESVVSEDTESLLNERFTSYMNGYLTANEPEVVGTISVSYDGDSYDANLYKYTILASAENKTYFEMYYCLYTDTKMLAFFINSGNELADMTSEGTQASMDEALANEDIISLLSQENVTASIESEQVFNIFMDSVITELGGLPVLCGKDFADDSDGTVLTFAKSVNIKANNTALTYEDEASESAAEGESSVQESTTDTSLNGDAEDEGSTGNSAD